MRSFEHDRLRRLGYPPRLVRAIRQLGEYKGKQDLFVRQTPQVLETLLRAAMIESTESSNRIEGVVAPHRRVKALVEKNATPANRSEAEIAGYRDVLNTIHSNHAAVAITTRADAGETAFTPRLVLQFHRDLFSYAPGTGGRWKTTDNDIVERLPDGSTRVRFKPVHAHEVARFMDALHERFGAEWQAGEVDALVLIPAYVLDFLCIHPFLDGNGRMARLLSLLLLYKAEFTVGRYISLERIVEQSRDSYYDALYRSSQGWHEGQHDILPWIEYFTGVLISASREFEARVGAMTGARGAKTQMVKQAVATLPAVFRITDVEERCPNVSREMIRHVLQELRKSGLLAREGAGPAAVWRKLPDPERQSDA